MLKRRFSAPSESFGVFQEQLSEFRQRFSECKSISRKGISRHDQYSTRTTLLGTTPGAIPQIDGNPHERCSLAPAFLERFLKRTLSQSSQSPAKPQWGGFFCRNKKIVIASDFPSQRKIARLSGGGGGTSFGTQRIAAIFTCVRKPQSQSQKHRNTWCTQMFSSIVVVPGCQISWAAAQGTQQMIFPRDLTALQILRRVNSNRHGEYYEARNDYTHNSETILLCSRCVCNWKIIP